MILCTVVSRAARPNRYLIHRVRIGAHGYAAVVSYLLRAALLNMGCYGFTVEESKTTL